VAGIVDQQFEKAKLFRLSQYWAGTGEINLWAGYRHCMQ
jgi:hypothetical protein